MMHKIYKTVRVYTFERCALGIFAAKIPGTGIKSGAGKHKTVWKN